MPQQHQLALANLKVTHPSMRSGASGASGNLEAMKTSASLQKAAPPYWQQVVGLQHGRTAAKVRAPEPDQALRQGDSSCVRRAYRN